jgi:hypothetical protein
MMALTKKTKLCNFPGCGKEFQPTGNCQKKCPEHQGKPIPKEPAGRKSSAPVAGTAGPDLGKSARAIVPKKGSVSMILADEIESERVIRILIAGGFVTEEKVQAARRLVAGL